MVGKQNADIAETLQLRDIAGQLFLPFYICDAHLCHLSNTTDPSSSGGGTISLTICF